MAKKHGITNVVSFPVDDLSENDDYVKAIYKVVNVIREIVESNQKVFVHCTSGISRAPTIGTLYLCIYEGMTVGDAVKSIKKFNPLAQPN